ncbi:MAG: DUF2007 domain-containing protein [Proteobacteria bacterium]|nr:DUF2007 domain-containing protein [Pseudomonadota bacterium]
MIELLKSNNPVRLQVLKSLLEDAGLNPLLVEASAYPGVIDASLQAPDEEADQARRIIEDVERDLG